MSESNQTDKPTLALWTPRTIGWLTLLLGFAGGFVLAAINWYRMGLRRKAALHLILGLGVALLSIAAQSALNRKFPLPSKAVLIAAIIANLLLVFLIVAYLHTATQKDIAKLQMRYTVQSASKVVAVCIAVVALVIMIFVSPVIDRGVAFAMAPQVKVTSTLILGGTPSVKGHLRHWTNEPLTGRHIHVMFSGADCAE